MADYVTFVRGREDVEIASSVFQDAAAFWVSGRMAPKLRSVIPTTVKTWVDASVDGLKNWPNLSDDSYRDYVSQFIHHEQIGEEQFQKKPDAKIVRTFIESVLSKTIDVAPGSGWVSVPQLPYSEDRKRNAINRALARATREWRAGGKFKGQLVLPVILTHQRQLNKKVQRNTYVEMAVQCLQFSGAERVWIVDSSLNDQAGTGTFEHERFPGIVSFHEELNNKLSTECRTIAGPYWGMNLILWARQLIHHPAVSVGKAYQYYIPGNQFSSSSVRVALPGLRRMALCSPELKSWLQESVAKMGPKIASSEEFKKLEKQAASLRHNEDLAKRQVAVYYRDWLSKLESTPQESRAIALYQDFSSAFVLGKSLPDLKGPEPVKNPSRIAKQFMNNCL